MADAKTSLRAEKRVLREKMRSLGFGYRDIAAEFARRYRSRPRTAWREAHGWTLREAAEQVNSHCGKVGLDRGAISGLTAAHLCEYESWPGLDAKSSGRRPTPCLLALLAAVYCCDIADLIDLADRERLPPADILIVDARRPNSSRPAGDLANLPHRAHPQAAAEADRGPGHRVEAVLRAYADVIYDASASRHGIDVIAATGQHGHMAEIDGELAAFVERLLADGIASGVIRSDVASTELAAYCLASLSAARTAASREAVIRLVTVTLAGLGMCLTCSQ